MPEGPQPMRPFDFTIRTPLPEPDGLGGPWFDAVTDAAFAAFEGDVVPAAIGGDLVLECTVEAASLADAVREVAALLREVPGGDGLAGPVPFRVEAAGEDLLAA